MLLLPVPNRVREPLGLVPSGNQRTSWWVLRNENFRFYFYGSVVSDLGTWLQNTAQVLLAYRLAHSVFAVGWSPARSSRARSCLARGRA